MNDLEEMGMCEFIVVLRGQEVSKDIIYAKADGITVH